MPTAMKVILLERIDSLGKMGEIVKVKPGYARNFLLPGRKALRATPENMAYFEGQRAALEKTNAERRKEAEKIARKLDGIKVPVIRLASEGGQLYGSVSSRDVAQAVTQESGIEVSRNQVEINQAFKTIGLFPVAVILHPEVKVFVTVNIARSEEEAKTQAKTGRALIVDETGEAVAGPDEEQIKAALLDETALEAERLEAGEKAEEAAEDDEKAAARKPKRAKSKTSVKEEEGTEE